MFNPQVETKCINVTYETKQKIELFLRQNMTYKQIAFENSALLKKNPMSKYQTEATRQEYYELYIDDLEFDLSVSKRGEFYTNVKVDSVFINQEFDLDIFKEILLKNNVIQKEEPPKTESTSYNWRDLIVNATKVLMELKTKELVLDNLDAITIPEIRDRLEVLAKKRLFFEVTETGRMLEDFYWIMKRFISHKERCDKAKLHFIEENPEEVDNPDLDLKIKEMVDKKENEEDLGYRLSELNVSMIPVDLYELNFKDTKEGVQLKFGKNETHFYIINFYSKNLIITEKEIKIEGNRFINQEDNLKNIKTIGKTIKL